VGKEEKDWDDCKWGWGAGGAKVLSRLYGVTWGWELRLRAGKVLLPPVEGCDEGDMFMSDKEWARSSG